MSDLELRARECLEHLDGFGFATQAEFDQAMFKGADVVRAMIAFAKHRLASSRQEERLSGMRELLAKATAISAYSISDPLAVRIVFDSDEDRAAFADAIDAALEPPPKQHREKKDERTRA